MNTADRVLLVVIGTRGDLRSSSLDILTSQVTKCIFIEPVRIVAGVRTASTVDDQQSKLLCGRRLSDSELGCAIAHRTASSAAYWELSRNSALEWAIIVEDDADLDWITFKRIQSDLSDASLGLPSLVSFNSANVSQNRRATTLAGVRNALKARRHLDGIAVCYAVNQRGLAEIHRFSTRPISCVADWPLHYSRLKFFKSVYTRVSEVEGGSTIGYRPRLGVGNRLVLHIRQLRHIRRIAANHGVTVVDAVGQLIVFPAWRDSKARLESIAKHFRLSLVQSRSKI